MSITDRVLDGKKWVQYNPLTEVLTVASGLHEIRVTRTHIQLKEVSYSSSVADREHSLPLTSEVLQTLDHSDVASGYFNHSDVTRLLAFYGEFG